MKVIREGGRSPWGVIDQSVKLEGVPAYWVDTPSHGGMGVDYGWGIQNLSAAAVEAGRGATSSILWYEEDCAWAIPAYENEDIACAALVWLNNNRQWPMSYGEFMERVQSAVNWCPEYIAMLRAEGDVT